MSKVWPSRSRRAQRPPGRSFFSSTVTRSPAPARCAAAVNPPAPAPMITTWAGVTKDLTNGRGLRA